MTKTDQQYTGLPWRKYGQTRQGIDCSGLARLFLSEQFGFNFPAPETKEQETKRLAISSEYFHPGVGSADQLKRGTLVFFCSKKSGAVLHVCVALGKGKLLNIISGYDSRIENGFTLLERVGLTPCGTIAPDEFERIENALKDQNLGGMDPVSVWILVGISLALSAASYLLAPKAGAPNQKGKYSYDGLVTQNSPQIPLPDILGQMVVAGNSPYTQLVDGNVSISDATAQKANKIVVLQSGPSELIDYNTGLKLNGKNWNDASFYDGTGIQGLVANPAQSKAEAVTGTIGGENDVPSFTVYDGAYRTTVPVDVRAQYDRTFPIYGLSGCSYLVFRLSDSTKFSQFNLTCRVKGRQCRTFTSAGFDTTAVVTEVLVPDSVTTRFKLAHWDIAAVSSITQGVTTFTEISATNQAGSIYYLNKTKGYIEFLTAPTSGTNIEVDYTYYPREWTQNPANQMVYLLTDKMRGKGFAEARIDFESAAALRDFCDEVIAYNASEGMVIGERYKSNYVLDSRQPIQQHLQALLDACYSYLILNQGRCRLKARDEAASVFSFDTSNIVLDSGRSTFVSEEVDRTERPNRVKVAYHTEDAYNAETEVAADDLADQREREPRIGNDGVVEENLKFPAVTDPAQAERMAGIILREHLGSMRTAEWKTNVKGLAIEPGDVVDVTHPSQPTWDAKLFRVEELVHDDTDSLVIRGSEYAPQAYV